MPHLQMPHLQMAVFQMVVTVSCGHRKEVLILANDTRQESHVTLPRGNCNPQLENGHLQMGHFETSCFQRSELQMFDL